MNTFYTIKGLERLSDMSFERSKKYFIVDDVLFQKENARGCRIHEVLAYMKDFGLYHSNTVTYCKGYIKIENGTIDKNYKNADCIMKYADFTKYVDSRIEQEEKEFKALCDECAIEDDYANERTHHDEYMSNVAKELGVRR